MSPPLPAGHLAQISVRQAIAGLLQVPEDLVEQPEHSEHLEHPLGHAGVCSPVLFPKARVVRWPAPKQSKAAQPANPASRRRSWMRQR